MVISLLQQTEAHNNCLPWISSQDRRVKYPQIERFKGRLELDTLYSQPEGSRPPATLLAHPAEKGWIFVPPRPSRSYRSRAFGSRPSSNPKKQSQSKKGRA